MTIDVPTLARMVAAVRASGRLPFASVATEVAEANRRSREVPARFRTGDRVTDYATAATDTIARGAVVATDVADDHTILVFHCVQAAAPPGGPDTVVEAVVRVSGGQAQLVTFGHPRAARAVP